MVTAPTPRAEAAYGADMANAPRTPVRQIRVPEDLWEDLDRAARAAGTDRATVVRQLIAWYVHRPGMPDQMQRPAQKAWRDLEPGSDE